MEGNSVREIKFRIWCKQTEEMHAVERMGFDEGELWYVEDENKKTDPPYFMDRNDSVLMQYTGLKDKNGREVYEGDVVKGHYYAYGKARRFIGEVKFIGVAFKVVGVKQYRGMHQELDRLYATIGNIYENPELLEETK